MHDKVGKEKFRNMVEMRNEANVYRCLLVNGEAE